MGSIFRVGIRYLGGYDHITNEGRPQNLPTIHSEASMKKVVTTLPVDIALRTLEADDVRKIHAWFDHLRNWDGDAFVRTHSHSLEEVPGVHVLNTSTDIRIFFRIDGNTITILDIAKKSAIMRSAGYIPEGG
jgi:hypothetical protein